MGALEGGAVSYERGNPVRSALDGPKLLHRNEKRFRGGLVFKAHRWLYHSTLGSREIKKRRREEGPKESQRREAALEATQGQMNGVSSQLPYKCHLEEVASVGDCLQICPQIDYRVS